MTPEEFMRLAETKKELESFLELTKDPSFDMIAAHSYICSNNTYRFITNKEIVNEIVALAQKKLDEINKTIEEL